MDVAVFRPLKELWRKTVRKYRMQNDGKKINIEDFTPLFQKTLRLIFAKTLSVSFTACSLLPYNYNSMKFLSDETVEKNSVLRTKNQYKYRSAGHRNSNECINANQF